MPWLLLIHCIYISLLHMLTFPFSYGSLFLYILTLSPMLRLLYNLVCFAFIFILTYTSNSFPGFLASCGVIPVAPCVTVLDREVHATHQCLQAQMVAGLNVFHKPKEQAVISPRACENCNGAFHSEQAAGTPLGRFTKVSNKRSV